MREGFTSRTAVRECLEIQSKLKSFGVEPKKLGEIMVEKGFLRQEDVQAILEVQSLGGSRLDSRSGNISEYGRAKLKTSKAVSKRGLKSAPVIPGYEIVELLGEGGMGVVYKARQKSLDRMVALKILPQRAAKEKAFIERFIREARTVARLNHENIIAGIDVGEADGTYYFAMEYVEGESVADMIDRIGPLEERTALQLTAQMARALAHAHKHGLVHRDVKPQNILVTRNSMAKLCDLGLAKSKIQEDDTGGSPVGTPHYLSPEQARGEADVDIRSDIYSLGATLYHMLTGGTPFEGQSPMVLMTKHLTEEPQSPRRRDPRISKAASDLVLTMMEKEKEDRHQTPTELLEDVERVMAGKGKRTSGTSHRTSGRRSRRKSGPRSSPLGDSRRGPRESSTGPVSRGPRRGGGGGRGRAVVRARQSSGGDSTTLMVIALIVLALGGTAVFVLMQPPALPGHDGQVVTEEMQKQADEDLRRYRAIEQQDPTTARDGYQEILRQYPNTHAAQLARSYLADMDG